MSIVFRFVMLVAWALLTSCASAQSRPEEPALTESILRQPVAELKSLPPQSQAERQQLLRAGVEELLRAHFVVGAQHGFAYDPKAVAGAIVRSNVKGRVEVELGGVWLDVGPGAGEGVAVMVWRLSGEGPRYLAYAWPTHSEPGERSSVVGLFELEKRPEAPADKPHPKTGLWGSG